MSLGSERQAARPERGSEGYVLFGVVIGLVILGISLTAAVPLWEKIVQREREQELIFRGYQYMQAIQRYQERFPGSFPPNVDVLVEQKFLRRAYTDPFAWTEEGEGEFRILRQMSPELQVMQQQGAREAGRAAGITDLNRSRGRTSTPGGTPGGTPGSTRQPTGGRFQSTLGRTASGGGAALGGIVGVASSHDEPTFYKVPGKETYRDWLFVYGVATMAPAVRRTSPATPGSRARSRDFRRLRD